MPKILINEKDQTSPGTPGSYANYSVLVPGFMSRTAVLTADAEADTTGQTKADKVQPDTNGVYEFTSKQDFEDTVGFSAAEKAAGVAGIEFGDGDAKEIHYGKRIAHALLNLGYTVIYAPITSITGDTSITSETFWEIFKDKASYDFRFVSHGLLETSSYDTTAEAAYTARLTEIDADITKLADITKAVEATDGFASKSTEEKAAAYEAAYQNAIKSIENGGDGYEGFKKTDTEGKASAEVYASYSAAAAQLTANASGVISAKASIQSLLDTLTSSAITATAINNANSAITKLARYIADSTDAIPGRGDCVALIELPESSYVSSTANKRPEALIIEAVNVLPAHIFEDGTYCAITVPSLYYKMSSGVYKFPACFHYLACFMSSLRSGFAEWYAVAGYTRGVSGYTIDHTSVKLGEIAINALEPRNKVDSNSPNAACNVIANFRGSYYLWGNRTAHQLDEKAAGGDLVAHHFLNIRQLCTTIKKQLYVACRRFTFDPNSDTLWFNFVNAITPTLDAMKADQGIRDYRILKIFTDKKATLKAKIRIIPIEAVEDFDIEISLEDSFGETSVTAN